MPPTRNAKRVKSFSNTVAKSKAARRFRVVTGLAAFVVVAIGVAAASSLARISQENRSSASGCQLGATSCSSKTGLLWECDGNSFQEKPGPVVCNQALVDANLANSSYTADGRCRDYRHRCVDGKEQICFGGIWEQLHYSCDIGAKPRQGEACPNDTYACRDGRYFYCQCTNGTDCSWQDHGPKNFCNDDYYSWDGNSSSSPQPIPGEPIGWIDSADNSTVRGWAVDPDRKEESIDVHFYLNGPAGSSGAVFMGSTRADLPRPDVNTHLGIPNSQALHGYEFYIPNEFRNGKQATIFAHGIDLTGNANQLLSPREGKVVQFRSTKEPVGWVDVIDVSSQNGTIIRGWAADPDALSESIKVHFYLDGPAGSPAAVFMGEVQTNILREDVNAHLGPDSAGRRHGFEFMVPIQFLDGKQHTVFAHGIDINGDANQLLEPRRGKQAQFPNATPPRAKILGIF